jgi:ActR/RegA family two-component response regulator
MAKTKLLLVDDEPLIVQTLSAIMTMNGFEVTTASTVADALRRARE